MVEFTCILLSLTFTITVADWTNVALGKPTSQSSKFLDESQRGLSKLAVDGNSSGNFGSETCTHTNGRKTQPTEWWQVDLLGEYIISHIVIYNRDDCCSERLHDFRIDVLTYVVRENISLCSSHPGPAGRGLVNLTCVKPIRGHAVRVTKPMSRDTDVLTLCEVEVFGDRAPEIPNIGEFSSISQLKSMVNAVLGSLGKEKTTGFTIKDSSQRPVVCP